ncbi:MAG: hypothetical protein L3I99_07860 [Sulfurimonas sp.]|nr:hypothetical protein [Sulfurimonas sp.]
MKNFAIYLVLLCIGMFFSACGIGGVKIVIPTYTAPKEAAKISKIQTKDEFISDDAYLALWINPDVKNTQKTNKKLRSLLINNIKAKFTQTNFITLDPFGSDDGVSLNMEIGSYSYTDNGNKISLSLEVIFILSRGVDEFLVKTYSDRINRQSKDKTKLPTEYELASDAVAKVARYFVSDISPLKTNQLREFKYMPKDLKAVIPYAKNKNYKGAIKLMNRYDGKKDKNFHYNLAILYEAQASTTENMKLLKRAQSNYEISMSLGGFDDKLIINAKSQFDKFYDLLDRTKQQDKINQALRDNRNSMIGSSEDEYK